MRRLIRLVSKFAMVGWLRGRITDFHFRRWKRHSPLASFAEFYAERVATKILTGRHHKTLGARAWEPGHGPGIELDRFSFAARGLENWAQVLDFGVTTDMRCVDYGCGSLRIGQHAIRYLDVGNYWGVDVTDVFIAEGLKLIDPKLIEARKPQFGTIDDGLLARIRVWEPDFIFANAVLVHVPPAELTLFFKRIQSIMTRRSKVVIIYISSERTKRVKSMNWAYSEATIREAVQTAGVTFKTMFVDVHKGPQFVDGRPRRALLLHGASPG